MHSLSFWEREMNTSRVCIFVDFWNLSLSIREHAGKDYRLDWKALSPFLVAEAETLLGASLQFEKTRVYLSYNPKSPEDRKLREWSTYTLARFPGIQVFSNKRQARYPPLCPQCHHRVESCPHCGGKMKGTMEKGIDTAIVTDMIRLAWEDAWDVAILVSSDRDYIPAVKFLREKGRHVINVHFPPKGAHLAKNCSGTINLHLHLTDLSR